MSTSMVTLKVFTNEKGEFGNPVGIIFDTEAKLSKEKRQEIATGSGYSEIVFIDNLIKLEVSIYSPQRKIPFAGHALVGTAYYLRNQHKLDLTSIISMGELIKTWTEDNATWVEGLISTAPPWKFNQVDNSKVVESVAKNDRDKMEHTVVWAWADEQKGIVRARTFAPDWGIPEDEANGSGSMLLSHNLGRSLRINHGKGSVIYSKPVDANYAAVGGLVELS